MKIKNNVDKWKPSKNQKGLTLVELMVTLSLICIVFFVGYSVYIVGVKGFNHELSIMELQNNTREATKIVTSEMRQANTYTIIPYEIGVTTYVDLGTDQLKLESSDDFVRIYLSNDTLYCYRQNKSDSSEKTSIIANNMSSFKVSETGPKQLRVVIKSNLDKNGKYSELTSDVVIRQD